MKERWRKFKEGLVNFFSPGHRAKARNMMTSLGMDGKGKTADIIGGWSQISSRLGSR